MPGDYDYWFDGGACRIETGTTTYVLNDGVKVLVGLPRQDMLAIDILFPNGTRVHVEKDTFGS